DSEISGNLADIAGAIEADYAPTTLRRTLVSDNEARASGALLFNIAADALLENVTISGNRGNPGAILNDGGSHLTLVNSTVTRNGPAPGSGATVGGIQDVHGGFGFTFLANTILSGNGPGFIADDCERATSFGGNIVGDSAHCEFDAGATDQLDADPALGPLADNGGFTRTHLIGADALDRGTTGNCAPTDQRGIERPIDGDADGVAACDVGAVELMLDAIFVSGFDA
ncbi:MAG: choice-of-anchor Q domain-containing protein, partial [Rhodanobacteraceae bacterium]